MTYSESQKQLLYTLKDEGCSWLTIGKALGKNPNAVRMYWERNVDLQNLPPKQKPQKQRPVDGMDF